METPSELAHDVTQHVSDWERGTAGHHMHYRPVAIHKPVDPDLHEALVRWREGTGAHGRLVPTVGPNDHAKGSADAITVTAYVDLGSETCREALLLVSRLSERHPMRLVVRHLPLADAHMLALPAAETLEAAAAQGRFFEVFDEFARGGFEDEDEIIEVAGELVPDADRLKTEVTAARHRPRIIEHIHYATASGAHRVPELYIDGVRYDGEFDPAALAHAVGRPVPT
jgi:protein-disulfide isomerase